MEKRPTWQEIRRLSTWRDIGQGKAQAILAATIAVGTIDQALLSIVQTAHAHLRSVCLDRSLLVVDEVHASDLYMSRLLRFLLTHHLGVGGCAMLLSATLGSRALNEYIQITKSDSMLPDLPTATKAPYPSLTLSNGQIVATASAKRTKKCILIYVNGLCPEETVDQVLAPTGKRGQGCWW